nr:diguanylate cyclase [Caldimonas mangrovi]
MHARVRQDVGPPQWVFDPNNTLIEHVEARLYGSDGSRQVLRSGYREQREYALHYGKEVVLAPGVEYEVLVRFESPYFASVPRFQLLTETDYQRKVLEENLVILGSLGAMVALAAFNLFVFALTRIRSHLYYAMQLVMACIAWALVFQLPAELFGWHDLRVHYVPFFLLPAISALFCIDFLELPKRHPKLHRALRALIAVALVLTPLAVFAVPYAHATATLLISAWLVLMVTSGVVSWWHGYRPARFFALAFAAMFVPALIILPGNIGLIPDLVENAEMLTLFGGVIEALLQAFALADRIRTLNLEKDSYAMQLGRALEVAHTDAMTGIGNRYAFERALNDRGTPTEHELVPHMLLLIDLDGLKQINDRHGHSRGDELLKAVARGLSELTQGRASCFRLGGDEFAILAPHHLEHELERSLALLETELVARGFEDAGISYGIAHWTANARALDLINLADQNMYQHKARRKRARADLVAGDSAAL